MRLRHGDKGAFVNVPEDRVERLLAAGFVSGDKKSTAALKKEATARRREAAAAAKAEEAEEVEGDTPETPETPDD